MISGHPRHCEFYLPLDWTFSHFYEYVGAYFWKLLQSPGGVSSLHMLLLHSIQQGQDSIKTKTLFPDSQQRPSWILSLVIHDIKGFSVSLLGRDNSLDSSWDQSLFCPNSQSLFPSTFLHTKLSSHSISWIPKMDPTNIWCVSSVQLALFLTSSCKSYLPCVHWHLSFIVYPQSILLCTPPRSYTLT